MTTEKKGTTSSPEKTDKEKRAAIEHLFEQNKIVLLKNVRHDVGTALSRIPLAAEAQLMVAENNSILKELLEPIIKFSNTLSSISKKENKDDAEEEGGDKDGDDGIFETTQKELINKKNELFNQTLTEEEFLFQLTRVENQIVIQLLKQVLVTSKELIRIVSNIKDFLTTFDTSIAHKKEEQEAYNLLNQIFTLIDGRPEVMLATARDYITLLKIERGDQKPESINVNEYLENEIQQFQTRYADDVIITFKPTINEELIYNYTALLNRILDNLISNAVKYGKTDGERAQVTISLTKADNVGNVILSVSDEGEGMTEEEVNILLSGNFSKTRLKKHELANIPGTGLGLGIVKAGVKMMGGELQITSEVGRGSTFSVVMPKEVVATKETESTES